MTMMVLGPEGKTKKKKRKGGRYSLQKRSKCKTWQLSSHIWRTVCVGVKRPDVQNSREAETSMLTVSGGDVILYTKCLCKPWLWSNGTGCLMIQYASQHRMYQSRTLMVEGDSALDRMVDKLFHWDSCNFKILWYYQHWFILWGGLP